jgi:hypothetical protein
VDEKEWQIIRPVIARLRASVMAVSMGLLAGLGLFSATIWLVLRGAREVEGEMVIGPHLSLLSNFYPGYHVTFAGAFIGFAYAAATGAVVGYAVGWIYNTVALRGVKPSSGSRSSS